MPLVKLRLGNLNARGQQKGVDAQIRADMEALARHRAITDAVLVAGDEDMVPAVEAAQALRGAGSPVGRRAAVRHEPGRAAGLGVRHRRGAGRGVRQAVLHGPAGARGRTRPAGQASLRRPRRPPCPRRPSCSASGPAPRPAPRPRHLAAAAAAASKLGPDRERVEEAGEHVAQKWILTRGEDNIRDLLPGPILPPVIDKELLVEAEKELGQSLRPYQEAREWLRDAFWARVHRQFGIGTGRS